MSLCDNLISFVDGELDATDAEAFREHLRTCDVCPENLMEAVPLSAHLSMLPRTEISRPNIEHTAPSPGSPLPRSPAPEVDRSEPDQPAHKTVPHNNGRMPVVAIGGAPEPAKMMAGRMLGQADPGRMHSSGGRWRYMATRGGGIAAVVTAAAGIWHFIPTTSASVFADLESRPNEARLAYRDAARNLPVRDSMLGSGAASKRRIPLDAIARLEKRGDDHGAAIAGLWNGDKAKDVDTKLAGLPQTEPVRSDRAAMAVLTVDAANAEPVLAELESLEHSSDVFVARAARWNHALLLTRLSLPLAAAQAFEQIAGEHDAGWSEDAAGRAQKLRAQDFQARWQRADKAGEVLAATGTPIAPELVSEFPDTLRVYLYDAVLTAGSAERVRALAPLAAQLDHAGDPGRHTLTDYVERVARADFARRGPLATAYAALVRGEKPPAPIEAKLTTEVDDADVADIVMAAMFDRDVIVSHRAWFERWAKKHGDAWFEVMLARSEAEAELQNRNWLRALTVLQAGQKLCTRAVLYPCLQLERRLGMLYRDLNRIPESLTLLRKAVADAQAAHEWGRYQNLLTVLSDVERFHGATAMVRAYAAELGQMKMTCKDRSYFNRRLAGAAVLDGDGRAARSYLTDAMALPCTKLDLSIAALFSDVATLGPQPDDLPQFQRMLAGFPRPSTAEQSTAAALEGRVAIVTARDRTGGAALLHQAIALADATNGEVVADKARAAAYKMLTFEAVRGGDHAAALDLVARDLHRSAPDTCAVAMAAEGKLAAIAVRGPDGNAHGHYFEQRSRRDGPLTVPADLAQRVAGCARVGVMAPGALQGQPSVLPAELAWSYTARLPGAVAAAPSTPPPGGAHVLIISNVAPPPDLGLPPLSTELPDDVQATTLSGLAATPKRVLEAMPDATEVQFHTHALLDVGVSDASHLVLTPEQPGAPYALTAEAIRTVELRRRPVIVLEACHSAVGATYEHEPWSLPDAFLAAGARAVFAAATEVPDVASGQFFARVLKRVRAGAEPAVALRDERIATLRADPGNRWVSEVLLFE